MMNWIKRQLFILLLVAFLPIILLGFLVMFARIAWALGADAVTGWLLQ